MSKPRNIGDKIKELYASGMSLIEISRTLKCSKGSVGYHIHPEQKRKSYQRTVKRRKTVHPYRYKLETFVYRVARQKTRKKKTYNWSDLIKYKILLFSVKDKSVKPRKTKMVFSVDDVIKKFGENPKCYLTGTPIDIYKPRTYHFDHIVPVSRGGDCTLDNLGICTKEANEAKGKMTYQEFIDFCKQITDYHESHTLESD